LIGPQFVFTLPGLVFERVTVSDTLLTIDVRSSTASAACPDCQTRSDRVHSRHIRSLRDLPIGEYAVRLALHTRRFRCRNPDCRRRTFVERLPDIAPLYAQRTVRLTQSLIELGFALGGRAGSRLGRRLRLPVGKDTILRTVRRSGSTARPTPRVVGVDDFALHKGQSYGTILVDLERRWPVDLLLDRTAAVLSEWLGSHPGVEVITRDRSTEYARGATEGAPTARQVVDRFHLLINLREAIERLLTRIHGKLGALPFAVETARLLRARRRSAPRPLRVPSPTEQVARDARRGSRVARWETARTLFAQGTPIREIARVLDISWTTARNFAHTETYPERNPKRPQVSLIDPYVGYLAQRWDEGCHNASQLWRELQEQGYPAARIQVARWARQQRQAPAPTSPRKHRQGSEVASATEAGPGRETGRVLLAGPRALVWVLLRAEDQLDAVETALLQHILQDTDVGVVRDLSQRFQEMVRRRLPDRLDEWLRACHRSNIVEMDNFATALERDLAAVRAGLTDTWSNGQVEGQITRLKLLKRAMYGQASLDLLRRRVLERR
jgi:transposase